MHTIKQWFAVFHCKKVYNEYQEIAKSSQEKAIAGRIGTIIMAGRICQLFFVEGDSSIWKTICKISQ